MAVNLPRIGRDYLGVQRWRDSQSDGGFSDRRWTYYNDDLDSALEICDLPLTTLLLISSIIS